VEAGVDLLVGTEPVNFCSKSHVTQLSQGSVNEVPTAKLQKEHLEVVVCEPLASVEVGCRLRLCVEVTEIDLAVETIGPLDLWVNGLQVIPYLSA
jgi:hypothetical protein